MANFTPTGLTAGANIDNLPIETLTEVFRQVAKQPDRVAAFYEINALRSTNRRFREVLESDPTIRSEFETLLRETQSARLRNARIEASDEAGTRTADDIITHHGVTDTASIAPIRLRAAERDINAGMDAQTAIERNGVTDTRQRKIRLWLQIRAPCISVDTPDCAAFLFR